MPRPGLADPVAVNKVSDGFTLAEERDVSMIGTPRPRTDHAGAKDSTVLRARRAVRFVAMNIQTLPIKRASRSGRREQLIAVAAEFFLHHSYDAVTVEMISARAGITGPGLYRHFQNKQALLIAVLEEPTQVVHEVAKRIAETTREPKAAIVAMVEIPHPAHPARTAEHAHLH